ncbi:GtrA family protein [Saccharopolyspora rhizosphaerae]|uniref:GtrA family protein n=1 Tax=Saccharopolyspora rhizosphaerae TaxID=2492662 RepID=A0A426K0C7_9PSEU|nr:GtrA family protein [Saccharopolyspora rhizosphaerae]RRO18796.1 GtrA family protein [Saccharopolyspora rhizosphaerae]
MWRRITGSQFGRFALVGGANTSVHWAVYLALWLVLPYLLAHVLATAVATLCSYALNCRFTFRVPPSGRSLLLFPLASLVLLGASTAAVALAVTVFGVDPVLAPVVGIALVPVTFVTSRAALTRRPGGEWRAAAAVALAAAGLAAMPLLVNPSFYFADDSAAQFLPMWHRLGERLLTGRWAFGLEPDAWMGGNLAAESLFGIWNPVHLLDFVLVALIGDLAVAAAVVKIQSLVLLAVGTHLLCRACGAGPAAAAALSVALPVSGFVLHYQAASWAGGLMGFAWLPWAWWALRRHLEQRASGVLPFVFCFLCISAGDPYGVLGLCLVFCGLAVEFGPRRLLLIGAAAASCLPLVFWPVLETSAVGWRSGRELFNSGLLVPGIGDLLNASTPGFLPQIISFGDYRMTVPAVFLAWFAVPLLPWLDWRRMPWRRCAAVLVVAGCAALLCLGPSNVWMFRWPLRHIALLHLAVAVLLAVALTAGLRRDRVRARAVTSALLVLGGGYLAVAAWPAQAPKHLIGLVLVTGLVVCALRTRLFVVLHLGTAVVLAVQLLWFPLNRDIADYRFPTDVAALRRDHAHLRGGTVVQVASRELIPPERIADRSAWSELLLGNMPVAAGVPSLVSYTGIGHDAMHTTLCLNYFGATCSHAYDRLWGPDRLADQLKAVHVVVQRRLREITAAPPGWRVAHRSAEVAVLSRVGPVPWPEGRVSVARGVRVVEDVQRGARTEVVRFTGSGELVFARLSWPGYRAAVNGTPVPTSATGAGLLTVRVPPGVTGGAVTLTWVPPGVEVGLLLVGLGALVAWVRPPRWAR